MTTMNLEDVFACNDANLYQIERLHSFMAFALYSLGLLVFIIFF
jgi:hypothetical protein